MPFTTLAERFEAQSKDIYNRFSPSRDQAVVVKPDTRGAFGSASRIKNDTRAVPTVSVLRDARRVSKFLASPEGLLFLGKQALLQTGNTFVNTKLYNPASPLLNVVPFLHTKRHLSTSLLAGESPGMLQNNTVNDVTSRFEVSGQLQALTSGQRSLIPVAGSIAKTYIATKLKNVANTIIPIPQSYATSRPEYKVFTEATGPRVFSPQPLSQRGTIRTSLKANIASTLLDAARKVTIGVTKAALNRILPRILRNTVSTPTVEPQEIDQNNISTFVEYATKYRQEFYDRNNIRTVGARVKNKYFNESKTGIVDNEKNPTLENTTRPTGYYPDKKSIKSILNDPYNIAPFTLSLDSNTVSYDNIKKEQPEKSDIIKFIFKEADGSAPVHFRALISSIKENVKPEFSEQRYVGRTERFVTYSGAKRSLSLSFNMVAFSPEEADGMWTKVNYLTGLAFPKGVKNGFMIPPLFKMTVGGLYDNQPCYIETLDYEFLDDTITYDIDREVPFAINVSMQLSILEKRSKFHNSPFYKITEISNRRLVDRLNQQIISG